ncbi:hypothetical protein ELQ90_15095 [Labedella phragmitis]|uniref:Large extracellular alpha-helical protein n=1 Tax=Labedella phragmitis TaxID=2498849 RepID=A0A3S3ZHT1_9MICO|nr:DUF5719 family protein [Labedella phragmitis]RWZ46374.1 hypothetical protein ELQ90_15095 [Labedella phragmitis]
MTTRPTVTRVVRTIVGVVGVGAAVATVLVTGRLDVPPIATEPASVTVTPTPAPQSRVCAGPLVEIGSDPAAATAASSIGSPSIIGGDGIIVASDVSPLAAPDDVAGGPGPSVLSAPPPEDATALAGSQSQSVTSERLAGFAASACVEATPETWLVGGSTDVGQSTVVLLANASTVEASVTLEVFGESGPIDAPGASGIVVAPGTQRIVPLAGIAPNVQLPAVHVTSIGAPIAATLQQSAVRAITPEGVDTVGATTAPATEHVIPGFAVPRAQPAEGVTGYDYRVPGVRVLSPGAFDSEVTITATPAGGAAGEPRIAVVPAGSAVDVPLDDLAPGFYSLTITSDIPVVTAAHAAVQAGDATDFAWFSAAQPLDESVTVAVAGSEPRTAVLSLVNPEAEDRSVGVVGPSGEREVVVPAGGAPVLVGDVAALSVLTDVEGLSAAVVYADGASFASFVIAPPSAASDPVVVRTR